MVRGDWWVDDTGMNLLKGVDGDVNNPIYLEDEAIIEFLSRIPEARSAFLRMVPNMLPDEQTRLNTLYAVAYPPPSNLMDEVTVSDNFQHYINTRGIHTSKPKRC